MSLGGDTEPSLEKEFRNRLAERTRFWVLALGRGTDKGIKDSAETIAPNGLSRFRDLQGRIAKDRGGREWHNRDQRLERIEPDGLGD